MATQVGSRCMWMFFSYGTGIQPQKKSVFGIHTPSIIQYGVLMSAGWFTLAPPPCHQGSFDWSMDGWKITIMMGCKLERMNDPIKMMFTLARRWVNKVRIALCCCCSYQLQKVITDKNLWVGYPFHQPTQGWLQKLYLGHGLDPTLMGE
jgi:hypothetical protein